MSKPVSHFVICLDRSGSMGSLREAAVKSFNENVAAIREGAKTSGQKATISLLTFGGSIKTEKFCDSLDDVETLTTRDYFPAGGTPLFDTVKVAVDQLQARYDAKDSNVSYLFVVITDGEENDSKEWISANFQEHMKRLQATDRYSFAFLLPKGAKRNFCSRYGIPEGNVQEWETTEKGMEYATQQVNAGISSYYDSRSKGLRSTSNFFTTDLSGLKTGDLWKAGLTPINNLVKVSDVNRTANIREFAEKELKVNYLIGRAFYQLTKDEKVQGHKKVMLRDRNTGNIYAGDQARQLLGLTTTQEVKVRPGDHANWDIFVQSTSTNRKLTPGTKLLYLI